MVQQQTEAEAVQAGPRGLTDLIERDHRALRRLIAALGTSRNPDRRRALLGQVLTSLVAHAAAEELALLPALRSVAGGARLADRARSEHREAEGLLGELRRLTPQDPVFDIYLHAFLDCVRTHMDAEERDLLPLARTALSEEGQHRWGDRYRSAAAHFPTRFPSLLPVLLPSARLAVAASDRFHRLRSRTSR